MLIMSHMYNELSALFMNNPERNHQSRCVFKRLMHIRAYPHMRHIAKIVKEQPPCMAFPRATPLYYKTKNYFSREKRGRDKKSLSFFHPHNTPVNTAKQKANVSPRKEYPSAAPPGWGLPRRSFPNARRYFVMMTQDCLYG